MTRLPMTALQARLDAAFARHPERKTLGDFRAPEWLVRAEREALAYASRIVTPHAEIAAMYPGKAPKLDPSRYTPDFVYDRVANGFQGMPPWRHEYSVDQLKSVVAYVLSREFPN